MFNITGLDLMDVCQIRQVLSGTGTPPGCVLVADDVGFGLRKHLECLINFNRSFDTHLILFDQLLAPVGFQLLCKLLVDCF